jgi:multidrug efflux pump subunit AcrB
VISVTGDISEDDPARAQAIVVELEETVLPKIAEETQVAFTLAGLAEQEDDFRNDATRGLVLTLAGIFMTLAWIFSSWTRPLGSDGYYSFRLDWHDLWPLVVRHPAIAVFRSRA